MDVNKIKEISLPINWGLLSHVDNIEYGIKQIIEYKFKHKVMVNEEIVIGYYLIRGCGIRQMYHKVLPRKIAERFKKEDDGFCYKTLDELLRKKRDIKEGKYEINSDGHVIGPSDSYLEEIRDKLKRDKGFET